MTPTIRVTTSTQVARIEMWDTQSCMKFKMFNAELVLGFEFSWARTELELLINTPLNIFELSSESIHRVSPTSLFLTQISL